MKMHPNLFPLNKKHINTQVWPCWIYLNSGRLCSICKAQSSPKLQCLAVGLGTEWLRKGLRGTLWRKNNSSKMWNPPRHSKPVQGPDTKRSPSWRGHVMVFPSGESHTISGGQDGADRQGRMKSPCFLQIKIFIASLMVHPKPELHSQCPSQELRLPWAEALPTQGSLLQHLPLESSVSSTRDLSLQGRKKPLLPLEPPDKMWSFCLRDAALRSWATRGRWRVLHTAWNSVLHGKCRSASLNSPPPSEAQGQSCHLNWCH